MGGLWGYSLTMNVQFRRVIVPKEVRSLVIFDHKTFHEYPGDWFERDHWKIYESWWLIVDGRRVGCCAFEANVDFKEDISEDRENRHLRGSLYIASTGILPAFRGLGLGSLMKCWQISYARRHGFTRIVANTRKSNRAMITLNRSFGFKVLRSTPNYYGDPSEPTVVMELCLPSQREGYRRSIQPDIEFIRNRANLRQAR